jgi:anti-anti-sigma factor
MLEQDLTYAVSEGSRPDIAILTLVGPLTLGKLFDVQNVIRTLTPQRLIVDMAGVPYMDSAGLGVLMNAFVSAQTHGRRLVLAGVSERIHALLELTKVNTLLQMADSVAAAETLA